ncbi:ATP-binding protein [Amycolatopsis orientalis]|uniref:ATP-binding protein n=1 Tax=Amycolatopsis orientalis TaxID=31958 RepID=UPI001F475FAA|nr:ATP-binding protein [Amycolatopsis orientalis]
MKSARSGYARWGTDELENKKGISPRDVKRLRRGAAKRGGVFRHRRLSSALRAVGPEGWPPSEALAVTGQDSGAAGAPWELDLRGTAVSALPRVRAWAGKSLGHLSPDHLADVLMVIEELASNAYEHTSGPSCARLTVLSRPCVVVIEVDDPEPGRPEVRPPNFERARGRGMLLVDRLADGWGVHEHAGGKTVWARLGCGVPEREACVSSR